MWDHVLRLRAEQELQVAADAARAHREAQSARDAHLAALYDTLERVREAQIADDRAIAEALEEDTSLDEDSAGEVSFDEDDVDEDNVDEDSGPEFLPPPPFDSNWNSGTRRNGTLSSGVLFSGDRLSTGYINGVPRSFSTQRQTSTRQQPPAPPPTFDCAVCFNSYPASGMTRLPCDHHYCPKCLSTLIDGAITASISRLNPQPFPPSCCPGHPIPYRSVIHFLTAQTRSNLTRHEALLSTPIEERIWCAQPDCGHFIPPSNRANTSRNNGNRPANADLVRCRTCQQHTCVQCKRLDLDHMGGAGGVCPEDTDVKALLATAQQRGWQQCFRCRSMVEKTDGCNHMTCTCGAQFCYVCGTRWQGRRCDHGF
ncbi:uncharacterized protein J3D65DRAFT_597663 [Phyllosticta citribraziliensis]|uniref:RBR-type E3 ubiquitin transferase n=1 Tax=Phyllosticta citribraziliensis TaxID=989973 RepID=A0ABR1L873_9PEZI